MLCKCFIHFIARRYDFHRTFNFTCHFEILGVRRKVLMGLPIICMLIIFCFCLSIWTGLCRHKTPTKLTENPLAAG